MGCVGAACSARSETTSTFRFFLDRLAIFIFFYFFMQDDDDDDDERGRATDEVAQEEPREASSVQQLEQVLHQPMIPGSIPRYSSLLFLNEVASFKEWICCTSCSVDA